MLTTCAKGTPACISAAGPRLPYVSVTPEEFRQNGYALIDWITDYIEGIEAFPVIDPELQPGDVRAALPAHPPTAIEPFDAVLRDLDAVILPGITHWQHPSFFAYFPANASYSSILGELASAGLSVQGMSWITSPACTEVETLMLDWMQELLGLPTTQAHSSIEKGLRIAGIGLDRMRMVPVDENFAMRVDELARMMAADIDAGLTPFFVCATHGTTSSTAFDPTAEIATVCNANNVWLHVDAAMSGIAALAPEYRWVNSGLELADSYCTNPHKWMGVNFDCDLFWTADRAALLGALSILPEYLRSKAAESGAVIDYRDWQVPLGRRFRSLKLWFTIRCDGIESIQAMIREHVRLTELLAGWVEADHRFEVVAPHPLNLLCIRLREGNEATDSLIERANLTGKALFTRTVLNSQSTLRISVGSRLTTESHVFAGWQLLQSLAQ